MPKISTLLFCFLIGFTCSVNAQQDSLYSTIKMLADAAKGRVSVSVIDIESSTQFEYYGDQPCVMQSVFKFPIALAILDRIDKGEFSLKHKIHITPKEMTKGTWSPMRDSFPDGNVNITFEKLLRYMVSQSDNIACDVQLRHLGKPKTVEKYIRKFGIEDFSMRYNEAGMHKRWNNQYKNWCTPKEMTNLLQLFYQGKIISKPNTEFLYQLMTETTTGQNRLVNLLPAGTIVAHKTGSSDTDSKGMTAAVNDVGIITLPNGKHIAIAVFVNDAYAPYEILERVIAQIGKAAYDNFRK
jgi:beta-lactamase class A